MTLDEQHRLSGCDPDHGEDVFAKRVHLVLCLIVLIAGVVVRLYGLGSESIDLEEYACLSGITISDFPAFFRHQRELYPYGAPLAPVLIYFWTRLAGDSIAHIRLFFALAGIFVMLLGYLVARLIFAAPELPSVGLSDERVSRRAGLIALACIAFSPVHVFHSQEARMYALVSLFALLGMAAFLLALKTGRRRWWGLHLLANVGLVSSHYFAVFLLPVYGLYLLLSERGVSRRALWWGVGHGLLAAILFAWVSAIPPQAEELYSYYEAPTAYTVLIHLVAGDSTTLSATSFFPSGASWHFLPKPVGEWIRSGHILFDAILIFMSFAAFIGGVIFFLRDSLHSGRSAALRWLLLLLWALVPVLLITALSFLWRPVYGSRYVVYSMFAVYLLAGGMIGRVPRKWHYAILAVLVIVTYGYQLSIALPPQTRTAWRQAYGQMYTESGDNAALLLEDPFWLQVLGMNIDSKYRVPVVAAFGRDTLCDAASRLEEASVIFSLSDAPDIWVLLVLTTDFDERAFVSCLEGNGLQFARTYFAGERNLALYRISRNKAKLSSASQQRADDLFGTLIAAMAKPEASPPLDAFSAEIRYLPDIEGGFWLRLGVEMAAHHHPVLAAAAFCRATGMSLNAALRLTELSESLAIPLEPSILAEVALESSEVDACARLGAFVQSAFYVENPAFIEALGRVMLDGVALCTEQYLYMGIAAHRKGDHEQAVNWFMRYPEIEKHVPPELLEAFGISLTETGAYEQAVQVLRSGIEMSPEYHWLQMRLGIALAASGNHEEAVEALNVSRHHAPGNGFIVYLLIESLVALGQYEEAASLAEEASVENNTDSWVLMARWRAYTGAGRDVEGAQVFLRLQETEPELKPFYEPLYGAPQPDRVREVLSAIEARDGFVFPEVYLLLDRLEKRR